MRDRIRKYAFVGTHKAAQELFTEVKLNLSTLYIIQHVLCIMYNVYCMKDRQYTEIVHRVTLTLWVPKLHRILKQRYITEL